MRKNDIQAAIIEAERFLASARELMGTPERADWRGGTRMGVGDPRRAGDIRRKSMDLTRALADLLRAHAR